jgi:long-chain fatty acid transport protein
VTAVRVRSGLGALLLLAVAPPATAAGFASARFGGEHGHVTTTDPTALYYNPGGLGLGHGTELVLDGVLALRGASWEHAAAPSDRADPPGAAGANTGRASLFNVFGAPMVGVVSRRAPLAFGASVSVPFGGRSRWSANPALSGSPFPLAAAGVQRWHSIEGALTSLTLTAGVAYRRGPFSLGVTGNLVRSSLHTLQAKNPTGSGDPDTTREGRISVDVAGTSASFGLGVAVEPLPGRLWLGASYQAQPGLGPMVLHGTLATTYQDAAPSRFAVTLTQALPDIWRLGARFRPVPTVELRLHGDRTRWSVLDTQCVALAGHPCAVYPDGGDATSDGSTIQNIRRRWNDTLGVHAGASLWPAGAVELFAGAGYETGAVPDSTLDPGLFDADNLELGLGGRLQVARGVHLRLSYTQVLYAARDNAGRSELAMAALPTRRADGGGHYTLWLGLIGAAVEAQF